jgi:hypothetical protein
MPLTLDGSNGITTSGGTPLVGAGQIGTTQLADGAVTTNKVADGTITNADVSASAAIAASKLSGLATVATSGSASDLSAGTVPTARLASGTANSSTYLRGDQTWSTISAGTVTSVATGNVLQGGTITTSGTLSVACPTHNTVGSYCSAGRQYEVADFSLTFGSNYAGGNGYSSIGPIAIRIESPQAYLIWANSSISGTWKWMGCTTGNISISSGVAGLACRVS